MAKTVLVLGAGMTGLPLAHYVLKHYAEKFDLKVVLVSPSSEFYWNIAAPRVVIPGQITDDQVLSSIPEAFSGYPAHQFEFILGKAEQWMPNDNHVIISTNSNKKRSIAYATLIIATGSQYQNNMPWKLGQDEKSTHEAIAKMRSDIAAAQSIVVAGGGPTGVEFAGELGYEYAQRGEKHITLVMSDSQPFESRVMPAVRAAGIKELEKLGVNVMTNTRIAEQITNKAGKVVLELVDTKGNKSSLETDLFVPAWGVQYNTSFAPASFKEPNGRLKVDETLRLPGHDNVFLLGDAANLDSYAAAVREMQVRHVAAAIGKHFSGAQIPKYTPPGKVTMTVAIGRGRGIGQIGSINLWSFLVWYFKGRHMCTNIVPDYVAGKTLILGSF